MLNLKSHVRAYQAFAKHHHQSLVVTSNRRTYGLVDPDGVFTSRHVCRGTAQEFERLTTDKSQRSFAERFETVNLVRADRLWTALGRPTDGDEDVEWRD